MNRRALLSLGGVAALLVAGCGSSAKSTYRPTPPPPSATTTSGQKTGTNPGALQGEAASAATGDIPDNQVFLSFVNGGPGYSIKYPEGWARSGSASNVSFRDKNNVIRILVTNGPRPTPALARSELAHQSSVKIESQPELVSLAGSPAVKVVYSTESAPSPVTGKRVTLVVDRYELGRGGRRATLDLGTPRGVDNVDAYRLISESFRWR